MTPEERNKKIEAMLEEKKLDWQSIHNWIFDKGYVILTQEEYDELEPMEN